MNIFIKQKQMRPVAVEANLLYNRFARSYVGDCGQVGFHNTVP